MDKDGPVAQGALWDDETIGLRRCSKCGKGKPLDQFFICRRRGQAPVRRGQCKACHQAYSRLRYAKKPDQEHARYQRLWLLGRYGLTVADYEAMRQRCGNLCEICRQPETRVKKGRLSALHIDHDHKTGKIRGLLCSHCNLMLGNAKDNPEALRAAIAYLQRHAGS